MCAPDKQAGLTVSLPQAPRKETAAAGMVSSRRTSEEDVPASQAEVLAAAAVAAHNPFPGGEVREVAGGFSQGVAHGPH